MELTAELAATGLRLPGVGWSGDVITFSIPGPGSTWPGYPPGEESTAPGYGTLTAAEADTFRHVISLYDNLIAPRVQEVDDLTGPGEIRVAKSGLPSGAWTYYPPGTSQEVIPAHGDLWFDPAETSGLQDLFLHELGHAFGLKHPRDEPNPMPVELQLQRYSVMGGALGDGFGFALNPDQTGVTGTLNHVYVTARTPMVADIAALQATYGADPETRAGDTIYTWAPNTPFLEAVYDASGVDTFDLSSHLRPSYVDLTPGSYSSIGIWTAAEQQAFFKSAYPSLDIDGWFQPDSQLYTYEHNLGLAFSTVVEDVLAGSGADTVIGNAAANLVSGGAGADAIFGDAGNDSLTGGQGTDFLRGGDGDDSISGGADFDNMQGNAGRDTLEGGDGDDWVLGGKDNDSLAGQAGADVINGNLGDDVGVGGEGDDVVRGGQGDDDLQGGGGNDLLFGDRGNDTLTGGAGADTFHFDGNGGHDRVTDFNLSAGDQVEIDDGANYTVTQVGGDTVVELASGAQLTLVGIQQSSLQGAWIVVA